MDFDKLLANLGIALNKSADVELTIEEIQKSGQLTPEQAEAVMELLKAKKPTKEHEENETAEEEEVEEKAKNKAKGKKGEEEEENYGETETEKSLYDNLLDNPEIEEVVNANPILTSLQSTLKSISDEIKSQNKKIEKQDKVIKSMAELIYAISPMVKSTNTLFDAVAKMPLPMKQIVFSQSTLTKSEKEALGTQVVDKFGKTQDVQKSNPALSLESRKLAFVKAYDEKKIGIDEFQKAESDNWVGYKCTPSTIEIVKSYFVK